MLQSKFDNSKHRGPQKIFRMIEISQYLATLKALREKYR